MNNGATPDSAGLASAQESRIKTSTGFDTPLRQQLKTVLESPHGCAIGPKRLQFNRVQLFDHISGCDWLFLFQRLA
jgi:hypothetical protein